MTKHLEKKIAKKLKKIAALKERIKVILIEVDNSSQWNYLDYSDLTGYLKETFAILEDKSPKEDEDKSLLSLLEEWEKRKKTTTEIK